MENKPNLKMKCVLSSENSGKSWEVVRIDYLASATTPHSKFSLSNSSGFNGMTLENPKGRITVKDSGKERKKIKRKCKGCGDLFQKTDYEDVRQWRQETGFCCEECKEQYVESLKKTSHP